MEIGNSHRNENKCDGAKENGKKPIYELRVYHRVTPHELKEIEDYYLSKKVDKVHIRSSDGVLFDAEPFKSESRMLQEHYVFNSGEIVVDSSSKTLELVKKFCEERAKILGDDYAEILNNYSAEKLDKFNESNFNFFQDNRSCAIQLITAAFELEIISLIHLMMEEAVKLFAKMTEDEVYTWFWVNLNEYHDDKYKAMEQDLFKEYYDDIFNTMKYELFSCLEFFCSNIIESYDVASKIVMQYKPENYLDPDVLKQKFHSLQSCEQKRQWVTAHFLLRRPYIADLYKIHLKEFVADADTDADEDEKCKMEMDSGSEVIKKLNFLCSDEVLIDGEPFKCESRVVRTLYNYKNFETREVESNSKTLETVAMFCVERGKIQDAARMDEFNSYILQLYRSHAIQLITAAFELEIISLIHLMMEEAVKLFTKMTEDEVYNFFWVNLKEYHEDKLKAMKLHLLNCDVFFDPNFIYSHDIDSKGVIDVTADSFWYLLERKFHSLENDAQRRQWLTAHFILRRPCNASFFRSFFKESAAATDDEGKDEER